VTHEAPSDLERLVSELHPDALWIEYWQHSEKAFTVTVLDLDYSYNRWLASLSLDNRWTLSPVYVA
jgi:hypothetical protein